MEEYKIFYEDILIGKLWINSEYKYCYEPNNSGVNEVKEKACLLRVMEEGTDKKFGEPILFFQERIRQMKLWKLDVIGYRTDNFIIKRVRDK